jgi:acetyltransferase-like isoleucine patch superfamily enzyme
VKHQRVSIGLAKTAQRHLVPSFVSALYFSLRYGCFVHPRAQVQLSNQIKFGQSTVVKSLAVVQTTQGSICFGKHCAISTFDHISAGEADITAGDYVRIGPSVTIIATTRNYRRKDILVVNQGYSDKGIRIGNDVLIGAGAIILDGSHIGDGAVIGVGSVVNGTISPYTVVFGSPAKPIFMRK